MTVVFLSTPTRDALDDKVNRIFAGKVVRKDLVRKVKVGANVPVFVLEYLLGKYCASSDEMSIQMGMQVVNDTLADNYIRPDEAQRAQSRVNSRRAVSKSISILPLSRSFRISLPSLCRPRRAMSMVSIWLGVAVLIAL